MVNPSLPCEPYKKLELNENSEHSFQQKEARRKKEKHTGFMFSNMLKYDTYSKVK